MGNEASRFCKFPKFTRIQKFRGSSTATVNHIKANPLQGPGSSSQDIDADNDGLEGVTSSEAEDIPLAKVGAQSSSASSTFGGRERVEKQGSLFNSSEAGGGPDSEEPQLPAAPQSEEEPHEGKRQRTSRRVIEDGETKNMRLQSTRSSGANQIGSSRSTIGSTGNRNSGRLVDKNGPLKTDVPGEGNGGGAIGRPFPKRPIACKLSTKTWKKLEELFRLMDQDGSNAVTREEARAFFKGAFSNLSADAMFNEVDTDGSGAITAEEFVKFWLQVRSSGYKEQDILDEVGELIEGGAWVDWKDGRDTVAHEVKFPKRPVLCRLSAKAWGRCEELFYKISGGDKEMAITRDKAQHFFKGAFCNISADAMFKEIDVQRHGVITPKEFMAFWIQVKSSGYKEKDILEEIENLMDGSPWVDWKDGRRT